MIEFEKVCLDKRPDLVIVVGDVNSTMACTITAKKLGIRVAHVEAGLRSRDMNMPEEINRLCTDVLCDVLFTTDLMAQDNLQNEGICAEKIHFVGNTMIDTLTKHKRRAGQLDFSDRLGLKPREYALVTLHRPSNVDDPLTLKGVLEALDEISREFPIVFPIHPRTRKKADAFGLGYIFRTGLPVQGLWVSEPLGYLEFLHLNMNARLVLTDSGGLQEETTVLGVPCITIRANTERPITCTQGTNQLVGSAKNEILTATRKLLARDCSPGIIPEKWDGQAAERIAQVLIKTFAS